MKFNVSAELINMYKKTGKNVNYMLDYVIGSIDYKNCSKFFSIVEELQLKGSICEIEITEDNVKTINSLFGKVNDKLIEKLLWVSLLFQEV